MAFWYVRGGNWEWHGDSKAMVRPLGRQPAYQSDPALEAQAAPRRIVLLDGERATWILAEPPAGQLLTEFRRLIRLLAGCSLAAEWQHADGRWLRLLKGRWSHENS